MVPQAHQSLVAVTLRDGVTREDVRRMLMILTEDAARLTQGTYALADSEPELSLRPARLTITFGFGRRLVDVVNPAARPDWLDSIPAFKLDQLREEWNDGDLLLQIASDDPLTVAHAQRMLLKDTRTFGSLRWVQQGFRRAYGSEKPGRTQRNLLGQLDGTVNMSPGSDDFAGVVWKGPVANPAWLDGGTGFVVRRIEMLLDKWDRLDRSGREQAVGRRMDSGAPLTGTKEHDEPDFEARTPIGFPVIAEFAHIRRARSADPHERMFRRAYNYDQFPREMRSRTRGSSSPPTNTTLQRSSHQCSDVSTSSISSTNGSCTSALLCSPYRLDAEKVSSSVIPSLKRDRVAHSLYAHHAVRGHGSDPVDRVEWACEARRRGTSHGPEELEDLYYGAKRLWKRFARRIFSIGKRDPGTQEENE